MSRILLRMMVGLLVMGTGLTAWGTPTPFDPLGESMPRFSTAASNWIIWLVVVGTSSTLFIWKHVGARWVLGAYAANHAVAIGTGSFLGAQLLTNGLVSLTHVVFWTPAVIVLIRQLPSISRGSIYGVWHWVALATMVVSLLFDYRDSFIYLFSEPVLSGPPLASAAA